MMTLESCHLLGSNEDLSYFVCYMHVWRGVRSKSCVTHLFQSKYENKE
jgi:hypothetical protein